MVLLDILRNNEEMSEMTEHEYREMYSEFAFESGAGMSDKGFEEFKAWRKRVEELFKVRLTDEEGSDSS